MCPHFPITLAENAVQNLFKCFMGSSFSKTNVTICSKSPWEGYHHLLIPIPHFPDFLKPTVFLDQHRTFQVFWNCSFQGQLSPSCCWSCRSILSSHITWSKCYVCHWSPFSLKHTSLGFQDKLCCFFSYFTGYFFSSGSFSDSSLYS